MGEIKKVATQEDLERLQEALEGAIDRSVKAIGMYNATTIELKLKEALENSASANGPYNATTRAYVAEIHEAVVTKDGQAQ